VNVAPGWYSVDTQSNAQAYWDGERWAGTRHWRGTGWIEDSGDPSSAPIGATTTPSAAGQIPPRFLPPPGYRGSMAPYQPQIARPMAQTTNGSAIASLVLSILGLFGIGSLLGVIFGFKARREIRASGGYQGGDGLALAGIIIGFVTLALFIFVLAIWIVAFTAIRSNISMVSSQQQRILQCESDVKSVETAVAAYQAEKGSFPDPPAPWSAGTYMINYAPLTSGENGGPYLHLTPGTTDYVVEYNSTGNVWVAPPNTFEASFDPNQGLGANPNACEAAAGG